MKPPMKDGRDLAIGDVVVCGGTCRTVTEFKEHPGHKGHTARILCSGDYSITVFDDDPYRLSSDGCYVQEHAWFGREQKLNGN